MSSFFSSKKIHDGGDSQVDEHTTPIPVDVYQYRNKLVILAPIAGITIEDVSVSITNDMLIIKGVRKKTEDIPLTDYYAQECFWGEFNRSIILPVPVDVNHVTAFYKRGVLRIEIPIIEEEKTKVIPITVDNES